MRNAHFEFAVSAALPEHIVAASAAVKKTVGNISDATLFFNPLAG